MASADIKADHQRSTGYEQSGAVCTLAYHYCLLPARYSMVKSARFLGHWQPCLPMEWGAMCSGRGANGRCFLC